MVETPPKRTKHILGWSEYVDLPDWNIRGLKAKVDTGARSSAVHVEDLQVLSDGEVQFRVVASRKNEAKNVLVVAKIEKRARVRSSNGKYGYRYFVRTPVRIGPMVKEVSVSLVSREKMLFRMLIGRKALEKDFLVDVSHKATRAKKRPVTKRKKKVKE